MQSQYPNASGLFSFSELWNAANPMGQVVANSLIESGADAAWGQLFKANRLPIVGKTTGYENATVRISSGSLRAEKYSHNWESADLNNVIQKFAGDNYNTYITDTGKKIYENPITKIQVVEDLSGNYFRIYNPSLPGSRQYLDLDGTVPHNKLLDNGKKMGMNKGEYNQSTHFKIKE